MLDAPNRLTLDLREFSVGPVSILGASKEIFLHIGHYKTGSSAIQDYLSRNADALKQHGYLYPASARPRNNPTNHGRLSLSLASDHGFVPPPWYRERPATDTAWAELDRELDAAPEGRVILSSEEFIQLGLRQDADAAVADLKARLAGHRVTVILYIREPMSLLKSWFNEVNKGPAPTRTFPVFFMNTHEAFLAQRPVWTVFARHFGRANLRVLTYKSVGSAHVVEFLDAVGCPLRPEQDLALVNRAQSLDALERRRLDKVAADRLEEFTVTRIAALDRLIRRAQRIADDYNEIAARSDHPLPSRIGAAAIMAHYADLLRPLQGSGRLNQREAENLRDMALRAEVVDLPLARALMEGARIIRPEGPLILKKLSDYRTALGEA